MGSLCSKDLNPLMGFRKEFLKKNFHGGLLSVSFFWLVGGEVTGWCSRNLSLQPSGCKQSGVQVLVLSLKLPSSTWVRVLVPVTQRYMSNCLIYPLRWNQDPTPSLHYCFLTAFPLFLHSLTFLMSNSLNLPFETQGRSRRLKPFPCKQEAGKTQEGDTRSPLY